MDVKLTIKLDKDIIEKTKRQAKKNNQSLSNLVENYFRKIISSSDNLSDEETPIVKDLKGIIKLDKDFDFHKEYADYLIKKFK
jgi:hypothetical protein